MRKLQRKHCKPTPFVFSRRLKEALLFPLWSSCTLWKGFIPLSPLLTSML